MPNKSVLVTSPQSYESIPNGLAKFYQNDAEDALFKVVVFKYFDDNEVQIGALMPKAVAPSILENKVPAIIGYVESSRGAIKKTEVEDWIYIELRKQDRTDESILEFLQGIALIDGVTNLNAVLTEMHLPTDFSQTTTVEEDEEQAQVNTLAL